MRSEFLLSDLLGIFDFLKHIRNFVRLIKKMKIKYSFLILHYIIFSPLEPQSVKIARRNISTLLNMVTDLATMRSKIRTIDATKLE